MIRYCWLLNHRGNHRLFLHYEESRSDSSDTSVTPPSSLNNTNNDDDVDNNNRPISSINLYKCWLATGNPNHIVGVIPIQQ